MPVIATAAMQQGRPEKFGLMILSAAPIVPSMTGDPDLFSPYQMGDLALPNRIVMAPLTRSRAGEDDVPGPLAVTYYVQRASAGLIITEGSQVSPQGVGYMHTPGIYSAAQVVGWKKVTDAVHRAGGRIFIQLWHVGRVSHPDFLDGALPVAPFCASRRRLCPHTRWKKANSSAQSPGDGGDAGHRRAVPAVLQKMPRLPVSTVSRSTVPTATC